jgi:5-methylcytosine-specific restriction endonuclease McrA
MKRALLLNADYTPLHFISDFDAITLFYKGRAEVIFGLDGARSEWDETFCSPSTTIRVPATMRLLKRVNKKWKQPRFRKKVLFNRDNWECQYCSTKLNWENITIDHVMPSSRGGTTSWLNCVAACKPCNKRKANYTPDEANMPLLKKSAVPSALHFWDAMRSNSWHEDWNTYVPRDKIKE